MGNELEKKEFMTQMESLRPDLFMPDEWSDEKKQRALDEVRPSKTRTAMFANIPIMCKGNRCVFAEVCPLLKKDLAPVGEKCPIEMAMVQQFQNEYMIDLGVDEDNLIEVALVRDLVDQEVQYHRKSWLLSMEHFIQENVMGVSPQGEVIMKKELHLAVELEDKLHRRKRDIRNQLLATRESKAKAGQQQLDSAITISSIIEKVDQLAQKKQKELEAKLGLDKVDSYIVDAELVENNDEE